MELGIMMRTGYYDENVGNHFLCDEILQRLSDSTLKMYKRAILFLNETTNGISYRKKRKVKTYPMLGKIGEAGKVFLERFTSEFRPAERTIRQYQTSLSRFAVRMAQDGVKLETLNETKVIGFISSVQNTSIYVCFPLRRFLHYLYTEHLTHIDLSCVLSSIKNHRAVKVPSVYTPEEIKNIESVVNRTSAIGKRNYAMLLLATRLGLRAGDIRTLRFNNIDWDNNVINIVQEKTKKEVELPLLTDIGEAIIDYIKNGRPRSDYKTIFLSGSHPYEPITTATFSTVITDIIYKTGIELKGRRHGVHCLRHSLATTMLQNGTSLPVISATLGHSNTQATMIYLSVNVCNLLRCSLDVPPVAEGFYTQKGGLFYE